MTALWSDPQEQMLRDEYEDCESLPELAQRIGFSVHRCTRKANKMGLKRQSATSVERREIQARASEASDTSGIVQSALAAQIDLERAWR